MPSESRQKPPRRSSRSRIGLEEPPLRYRRCLAGRTEAPGGVGLSADERAILLDDRRIDISDKALRMLRHMRKQILGQPARNVMVRGAAISMGVIPGGSECRVLVDELLRHPGLRPPALVLGPLAGQMGLASGQVAIRERWAGRSSKARCHPAAGRPPQQWPRRRRAASR